jgi:hypothetical protein
MSGGVSEVTPSEEQLSSLRAGLIDTLAHSSEDAKTLEAKVDKVLCKKFKKHCKKSKKGKGAFPALHDPVAAADTVTPEAAAAPLYDRTSAVRAVLSPITAPVVEGVRTELRHTREDFSIPAGSNPSLVAPLLNPLGTAAQVASGVSQLPGTLVNPVTSTPTRWVTGGAPAAAPVVGPQASRYSALDGMRSFREMRNAHAPTQSQGETAIPILSLILTKIPEISEIFQQLLKVDKVSWRVCDLVPHTDCSQRS